MQNPSYTMPFNLATSAEYSGANISVLLTAQEENAYPTSGWCTFVQALSLGGHVRKGEHGTKICYIQPRDDDDGKKGKVIRKTYTVFNLAQIDGLSESKEGVEVAA
jgi:antirestriction protein ArdC